MNKRKIALALGALFLLAGCGGPGQVTPTPIPATVARPQQPTPVYPSKADIFSVATPIGTAQFVAGDSSAAGIAAVEAPVDGQRAAVGLYIKNQTPAALGIASGGTAIYAEPGGRTLATVPVGGVLTVTGKSAAGDWYAVYNEDAVFGWAPAGQLRVYGAGTLVVVEQAPDPGPVATLLAEANQPIQVLDRLMAQMEANTGLANSTMATPIPTQEAAPASPDASATPAPGIVGRVTSEGRLNMRVTPDTSGAVVVKLEPAANVVVTGRTLTGDWLRIQAADGATGWAAAEFLALNQPVEDVPVVTPGE